MIVLRHLAGHSDTTPETSLRDLSAVLDLYAPVADDPAADEAVKVPGDTPLTDRDLPEEKPIAVRIDDMSDSMRETWRRLRGSAGFRPELFRAWEQSGNEPFPTLRIHDDEILYEIDASTVPGSAPLDEHGALLFSDRTLPDSAEGNLARLADSDPQAPAAQYFYRIDGTATLTRSRFLNLDLDVEVREPRYEVSLDQTAELPLAAESTAAPPIDLSRAPAQEGNTESLKPQSLQRTGPAADAPAFRVHRIRQKRQVKTEQMEYFDGPVIGVLVLVTGFDVSSETLLPENLP